MDAVQDNLVQSRALSYLPAWPACSLQTPKKDLRGSGEQQPQQLSPPAPFDVGRCRQGEDKPGFSVSCLCWLLSAREITSKGLSNFLSHPRKPEREQRISPAPPLQSYWAVDLPFLTSKAVYNWVVRKSLESSVRGMSFQRVGCEEILERWFLRRSSHYIFVLVPHVLFKKHHSMKDYSWESEQLFTN